MFGDDLLFHNAVTDLISPFGICVFVHPGSYSMFAFGEPFGVLCVTIFCQVFFHIVNF